MTEKQKQEQPNQQPNTQQSPANKGQKEPFRRVGYSPSARLRDNFMPSWDEDPYEKDE